MSRLKRWSRRAGLGLLGLFALIGGLVACNSLPTTLTDKAPETLRIASYNVNFGMAGSSAVADAIRKSGAQVVFLQETTRSRSRAYGWARPRRASRTTRTRLPWRQ